MICIFNVEFLSKINCVLNVFYICIYLKKMIGENICDLMYGVGIMMFVFKFFLNKV